MKPIHLLQYSILTILIAGALTGCTQRSGNHVTKEINVNLTKSLSKVDGFGVNITPAQWQNGKLKPALDMLVDDLGSTLFRFDCTGLANWLDPAKRQSNGIWPEAYLDSVYRSKVFSDAWETFRYLNKKGIEPFFNVSGRINPGLGKTSEWNTLTDFDGYAEMVASMLKWAREKEGLKFSLLAPFNETDLGYPEGPKINGVDMLTATRAILKRLDANGLKDINLIAIDDSHWRSAELEAVLSDSSYSSRIRAFGTHDYGDGDFSDMSDSNESGFTERIKHSAFRNASAWMTEYGDLDQTFEIEYEFAWRSTRRLMKSLSNGFTAGIAWDAFDNFHAHDTIWAEYGLLKTDTVNWTYTPRKRYFAAKQVYKFVLPGWQMVETTAPLPTKFDVYKQWHDPFRNLRVLAFASPDGNDYTILIMNAIESDVDMSINLNDTGTVSPAKTLHQFVTDKADNCSAKKDPTINNHIIRVLLPKNSISTITTLK